MTLNTVTDTSVVSDGDAVAITAAYGSAAGKVTSSRPEDVEPVRTIVDALGAQN